MTSDSERPRRRAELRPYPRSIVSNNERLELLLAPAALERVDALTDEMYRFLPGLSIVEEIGDDRSSRTTYAGSFSNVKLLSQGDDPERKGTRSYRVGRLFSERSVDEDFLIQVHEQYGVEGFVGLYSLSASPLGSTITRMGSWYVVNDQRNDLMAEGPLVGRNDVTCFEGGPWRDPEMRAYVSELELRNIKHIIRHDVPTSTKGETLQGGVRVKRTDLIG